jgi:hypothetical protein
MNGDDAVEAYDSLMARRKARLAREKAEAQARAQAAQTQSPPKDQHPQPALTV